jgi:hypothetical protein
MAQFSTQAEVDGIEHDGEESCSYCGGESDFEVRIRDGGTIYQGFACQSCSRENKLWIKENDCLESDGFAF